MIALRASDGHGFSAYAAEPAAAPLGGLVVIQEIFGVNDHIREVADGFAADGYRVIAPALFDRAERGVELGYDEAGRDKGIGLRRQVETDHMLLDVAAAVEALKDAGHVGIVGYCLGGSLAWLAACRLPGLSATVGYYGGMIASNLGEEPHCPVMLHFGEEDRGIPMADVEKIRAAVDPVQVQVFAYPEAGHAFNRHGSSAHHAESATLARQRTMDFLARHLG